MLVASTTLLFLLSNFTRMKATTIEGDTEQLDWEKLISNIVKEYGVTDPKLLELPEYIINIHFDTYDEMWETVLTFFEDSRIANS